MVVCLVFFLLSDYHHDVVKQLDINNVLLMVFFLVHSCESGFFIKMEKMLT